MVERGLSDEDQDGAHPGAVGAAAESAVVIEVALGLGMVTVAAAERVGRGAARLARPFLGFVLRPPLPSPRLQPATWIAQAMADLAHRGQDGGEAARVDLARLLDAVVPILVNEILDRLDLTAIVRERVDLDALASTVDLNAQVARVDLDAAAGRIDVESVANRLDLDAVAKRLDVDAVAARIDLDAVLNRLDLTRIVQERVDLEAILDQLDLTRIVRERVDLDTLVRSVDLNAVAAGIDVDAIAARVDLDPILERADLPRRAEEVMDAIDLPEIIRDSTGSVASETVRTVRMRGIAGDEAVDRVIDRFRLRRRPEVPGEPSPP